MACNDYNDEYLKKLSVYFNNFTEKQFIDFENEIFTEKIDKKKRAELEYARLKKEIGKDLKKYADYFEDIREVGTLLKVSDLSEDLLDEAYKIIVRIQLATGMSIRLYTAFPLIEDEEEKKRLQRMVGGDNGPKLNRKV